MSRKGFAWASNPWFSAFPGQHSYSPDSWPLRGVRFKSLADVYCHQASHQLVPASDLSEIGPDLDWACGPEMLPIILQPPWIAPLLQIGLPSSLLIFASAFPQFNFSLYTNSSCY